MTAIAEIITGKSTNVLRVANDAIRFRPAAGSELANKVASNKGGGRRGGPDMDQLKLSLGLDDATVRVINSELQDVMAGMRNQFQSLGAGGDRTALRQQMSQRMTAIFRKHLTPEQFEQYQKIRQQASETRAGQLWVQSEDGEINPVSVKLGISDDKYTQVFSKSVNEGTVVVTRIRNVTK